MHGGLSKDELKNENVNALKGLENLEDILIIQENLEYLLQLL